MSKLKAAFDAAVADSKTLAERESGTTENVIRTQLEGCFEGLAAEAMRAILPPARRGP